MCTLISLSSAQTCVAADGGIYESFIVDCDEITDVVFDGDDIITNFVMANIGAWVRYIYDDDDSAFYNQSSARTNRKVTITGQASFKYSGISNDIVKFSNSVKDCCCVVAVHFLNSGAALVQGIEKTATGFKFPKTKPKITPSIQTNTGADEDNAIILIDHVGSSFSHTTDLTAVDILAL
jgi:hypothetical protein